VEKKRLGERGARSPVGISSVVDVLETLNQLVKG
jgi:hypothetical protein